MTFKIWNNVRHNMEKCRQNRQIADRLIFLKMKRIVKYDDKKLLLMAKINNKKIKKHKYTTFFYFQPTLFHVVSGYVSVQYSQGTRNEFQKTFIFF